MRLSATGAYAPVAWGLPSSPTIPTPGDYDGDGRGDYVFYAADTGVWWILKSSRGSQLMAWGIPGETVIPVVGDYDGDGKTDLAF